MEKSHQQFVHRNIGYSLCSKWSPFARTHARRNCAVDIVEICNVYVGRMIIKAAKRIFNSDKICLSDSDLNFGVTFFGTQCSITQKHTQYTQINANKFTHSEMGPVWQNPIQRTARTAHLCVLVTVHSFSTQYNTDVVLWGWYRRGFVAA